MDLPINQIICGDCLEVMKEWPDNCVDLVVTSPPYDNLRDYKGYSFNFEGIAAQLHRVLKIGGVVVWVVNDATIDGSETGTSFRQALYFKEIGFNLHDTMIYQRHTIPHEHNRYQSDFEYMFVFSVGRPRTFNPLQSRKIWKDNRTVKNYGRTVCGTKKQGSNPKTDNKVIGNIWAYNVGGGHCSDDSNAHEHPAIFPEQLAIDHILSWSDKKNLVVDIMSGSGTVAKVAKMLGRNYIGIDISEEYCQIARDRIRAVETGVPIKEARAGQMALFDD